MSKRFTDSEKWDRPWFRELPIKYKALWFYILDKCDMAGVWYVDFGVASFMIGEKIERDHAEPIFKKQIEVIGDGKRWLIKDFVLFQYGKFSKGSNVHQGVLRCASVHGIGNPWGSLGIAYHKAINSPKDKDKAKEKAKALAQVKASFKDTAYTYSK